MKIFSLYHTNGSINTYIIGEKSGGDAIVIDPGQIDMHFINLLEEKSYNLKHILLTHSYENNYKFIKTLLQIYDVDLYCTSSNILDIETTVVKEGINLSLSGIDISVIELPENSKNSVAYRIKNTLFSGDALSAGRIGYTQTAEEKKQMQESIVKKVFSIQEDLIIFPSKGPPTTLKLEKKSNPFLVNTHSVEENIDS